jgi:hypothetical protein
LQQQPQGGWQVEQSSGAKDMTQNQELGNLLKALQLGGQFASVGAGGGITNYANQNFPAITNTIGQLNQLNQGRFGPQRQMPQQQGQTNQLQQQPQPMQTNAPTGGGRPISPGVAQLFLQKANGDKDLARQMARQAGFSF